MQNQRGSAASASSCSACGQIGKARTQTKVHSLHTCVRKHRHVPPPVKEGYRLHVLSRKHNELDTSMNNTHRYNICIQFLPIYQYFITIFHLKKKKKFKKKSCSRTSNEWYCGTKTKMLTRNENCFRTISTRIYIYILQAMKC